MASLQQDPSGNYHVTFRFAGRRFKRSLRTKLERKAIAATSHIEENIRLVDEGRLVIPGGADIPTFLMSDGRLAEKPEVPINITLGDLYDAFEKTLPPGAMEPMTLDVAQIHMRHIKRILGSTVVLRSLTRKDLQKYVTARSKEPGQRGDVSAVTIRKELATLSSLWNWAVGQGLTEGVFPRQGLIYPKQNEKPPFQTWSQIERQVEEDRLSDNEARHLWECLYLDKDEIEELLKFIKSESRYSFLHPMAAIAAFTGARRSELCRMQTTDVDLNQGVLTIRERKRSKSKKTTRLIPLSSHLQQVLDAWIKEKIKSSFLFPEDHRKQLQRRQREQEGCVTPYEAGYHLKQVLNDSKWKNLPGWHVFRHSFISNCASSGVDQRFIDAWVGHQTDEQRRRYRHLFPDSQKKVIDTVFV